MLIRDRYAKILEIVDSKVRVSSSSLASTLKISESTVRRDLIEMSSQGLLKLVRGGAESMTATLGRGEELLDNRYNLFKEHKESIGRYAASLIKPGDCVFIDSGSTTEKMCEFIEQDKALYVTIGIKQAMILSKRGLTATLAPGSIKQLTEGLQGCYTLEFLDRFNFSIAFFGVLGLTVDGGASTPDQQDAVIKSSVIKRCRNSYVLTDPSKFGVDASVRFSDLNDIKIITTKTAEKDREHYRRVTTLIEVGLPEQSRKAL